MDNYKNAFTEVYVILNSLVEEDYEKIPQNIIEAIVENRNKDYEFELNDELELKEHTLLPETKAILFNLFRDYLSTPEQKEKIIKMQNEERQKNELEKQQKYNVDVFANKKKDVTEEIKQETKELVEYKESFLNKVWNYIKNLFKSYNK